MRVTWHNATSISSSSPVSRYLGSGSFQRRLPRERQPDFIVAAGGGKAREPDRESFFYPCSPKNFPKETPTFKLFSFSLSLALSLSLSSQKRTFIRREQVAREHSRWFLAGEKLVEIFLFLRSTRSSLLFPVRITLQVFLILRVPSAMNFSLFLSLPQALFTCFRPGTSVPVSGLQVVSGTRNHCPLAVRFHGRV